ncbi:hypothetical protein E2562_013202 [Oryza meyeriana var. granulata]|uniref:Uncharacterized protein n=1 Tax=Oryza meyeriana var. granulata TaxID=110450 RepID=A0A6G1DID2_9ORYZ|nr:hypothetical protein E2562_013202 [Oryza meyeriana var. granulata]
MSLHSALTLHRRPNIPPLPPLVTVPTTIGKHSRIRRHSTSMLPPLSMSLARDAITRKEKMEATTEAYSWEEVPSPSSVRPVKAVAA